VFFIAYFIVIAHLACVESPQAIASVPSASRIWQWDLWWYIGLTCILLLSHNSKKTHGCALNGNHWWCWMIKCDILQARNWSIKTEAPETRYRRNICYFLMGRLAVSKCKTLYSMAIVWKDENVRKLDYPPQVFQRCLPSFRMKWWRGIWREVKFLILLSIVWSKLATRWILGESCQGAAPECQEIVLLKARPGNCTALVDADQTVAIPEIDTNKNNSTIHLGDRLVLMRTFI
jgi:hypothetical protein